MTKRHPAIAMLLLALLLVLPLHPALAGPAAPAPQGPVARATAGNGRTPIPAAGDDAPPLAAPRLQPVVVDTAPPAGAADANPYLPLRARFDSAMDPQTIDETTFYLESAAGPVTATVYYDSGRWTAVLVPADPLPAGLAYTATVSGAVEDENGTPMGSDYRWSFTTTAAAFAAYHGSLHNHTGYSDGVLDPNAAFTAGRTRGLDFMAVTDHSYMIDDAEWEDTMAQALSHTVDGAFVALAGCEYTNNTSGHANVFNTIRRPSWLDSGYAYDDYVHNLDEFYAWLAQHPEAVGQFNHPTWYGKNYNDWAYVPPADGAMQIVEVGAGPSGVWAEHEYRQGLDQGWRIGPTNNGDTHDDQWGIDNLGRSGMWATELSYAGVLEALQAMRLFATEDTNLEFYLQADGGWMGETIPNDGSLEIEVYLYDPDGEVASELLLYTNRGQVVASTAPSGNPFTWSFSLPISGTVQYFFARAQQPDGERAVTAPLWTHGPNLLINEFAARGEEWIELYNPTAAAVALDGWQLVADEGGLSHTFSAGTVLPGDGYLVLPTGGNLLHDDGDVVRLRAAGGAEADRVGYGIRGGAPLAPADRATARLPNGYDGRSDARDWSMDLSPTPGAANDDRPAVLGSSLAINEINHQAPPQGDALELFHPGAGEVALVGWLISDGDAWARLSTGTIPPGGWYSVDLADYGMNLGAADVLYLYTPQGVRVDQIGWYGAQESGTWQRICDGEGPHGGYDWATSGGGATWQDWPASLGAGNCVPIGGLSAGNDGPTALGDPTALQASVAVGSGVLYDWDFGDGTGGSGAQVGHTYPAVGSYTAWVTATNPVGSATAATVVVVEEAIAGLVAGNDGPTVLGWPTVLSATITAGTGVSYTWTFGDGGSGVGAVVSHTYPLVGVYTATVRASNAVGAQEASSVVVVVPASYRIALPLVVKGR